MDHATRHRLRREPFGGGRTKPAGHWLILLAVLVSSLLASTQVRNLQIRLDAKEMVPQAPIEASISPDVSRAYGLTDTIVVSIAPDSQNVFTPESLRFLLDVSSDLEGIDGLAPPRSLASIPIPNLAGGLLSAPRLTDEPLPDLQAAGTLGHDLSAMGLDQGMLLNSEHSAILLTAALDGSRTTKEVLADLRAKFARFKDTEILLGGAPVVQESLGSSLWNDLLIIFPATGLLLMLFLFAFYRSVAPVAVILSKIGLTGLLTGAAMSALGLDIFVPTLVLPVILILISISEDIFLIDHCFAELEGQTDEAWPNAVALGLSNSIKAIGIAAITTAAGLLALGLSSLEPYLVFGLSGAIGIGISYILTATFLPAALSVLPATAFRSASVLRSRHRQNLKIRFASGIWANRRVALMLLLIVAVGGAIFVPRLSINDNWLSNLDTQSAVVRDAERVEDLFPGAIALGLKVEDANGQNILEPKVATRVMALEQRLSAHVAALESPFADIFRANAAVRGEDYVAYTEPRYAGRIPFVSGELAEGELVGALFADSTIPARISPNGAQGYATIRLQNADYHAMTALLNGPLSPRTQEELGLKITPFGEAWEGYRAIDLLVHRHLRTILGALLATFILVALLMNSVTLAMLIMLPTTATIIAVHSVLAAMGIPLGLATAMFAAIAIGASADYAVHLVESYRAARLRGLLPKAAMDQAMSLAGSAILASGLVVMGGISVMLFSSIPPNVALGALVCLSLLLAAIFVLLLLPSLLLKLEETSA